MTQVGRRRLSLFSFGSKDSNLDHNPSTSPSGSQDYSVPENSEKFPLSENGESDTKSDTKSEEDLHIFERSVQDQIPPLLNSRRPTMTKLKSRNSSISLSTFKTEDYVPPALDATTSIIADSKTNLDDVEMIYSSRRNSSVMGLNMALGRSPSSPSRKNSVYSMSQLNNLPALNVNNVNPTNSTMTQSNSVNHPISPTSPPKLTSSKSSISFYSYADLLNNDEFAKRPTFNNSYSQSFIPTRKSSVSSKLHSNSHPHSPSLPSNQSFNNRKFNSSLNKFLISPESSDSEDDKLKNDNESFVSSSIGDCLRTNTAELNNSQ
ncbi:hypothetical protein CLIB1444_07S03158 [[Candida] jaroonii]|uniref:Uncharacterized protein n=1 Tax=[Candida] jaroonii TaxID=467808 RepID=A0ACA9YAF0_9ASCO|nr:hypothetical protein CLIB1444_07S03158 [[Candida] jaroonii]